MSYKFEKVFAHTALIAGLVVGIIGTQVLYDLTKVRAPGIGFSLSPTAIRAADLGLHSTVASYLWLFKTRTELIKFLFLPENGQEAQSARMLRDLNTLFEVDPRYSDPYAYSVIVLPAAKYSERIEDSILIGKRGVEQADPDWKIPFYLAVIYHLEKKDQISAAKYFDLAGQRPGIPDVVRTFAFNYRAAPTFRAQTKEIWKIIYETEKDPDLKKRAEAYLIHLELLDYLEAAVAQHKKRFGAYPQELNELVTKKIIPQIPEDPFGFTFYLYKNGEVRVK